MHALRNAIVGAALCVLPTVAGAQQGPGWWGQGPGMMGPGMHGGMMGQGMMGPGMMGPSMMGPGTGRLGDYLGIAKTQLAIEPPQEEAWTAYVAAVSGAAEAMAGQHQAMMSAWMQGPSSMPDMQEQMIAMMEARLAEAKDVNQAVKALYAQLSPPQRALADRILPQGMGMMGMM